MYCVKFEARRLKELRFPVTTGGHTVCGNLNTPPPPQVFCELSAEFGRTIPKIYDLRVLVCAVLLYRILLFLCVGEIQLPEKSKQILDVSSEGPSSGSYSSKWTIPQLTKIFISTSLDKMPS
jgi:hypothetical protein